MDLCPNCPGPRVPHHCRKPKGLAARIAALTASSSRGPPVQQQQQQQQQQHHHAAAAAAATAPPPSRIAPRPESADVSKPALQQADSRIHPSSNGKTLESQGCSTTSLHAGPDTGSTPKKPAAMDASDTAGFDESAWKPTLRLRAMGATSKASFAKCVPKSEPKASESLAKSEFSIASAHTPCMATPLAPSEKKMPKSKAGASESPARSDTTKASASTPRTATSKEIWVPRSKARAAESPARSDTTRASSTARTATSKAPSESRMPLNSARAPESPAGSDTMMAFDISSSSASKSRSEDRSPETNAITFEIPARSDVARTSASAPSAATYKAPFVKRMSKNKPKAAEGSFGSNTSLASTARRDAASCFRALMDWLEDEADQDMRSDEISFWESETEDHAQSVRMMQCSSLPQLSELQSTSPQQDEQQHSWVHGEVVATWSREGPSKHWRNRQCHADLRRKLIYCDSPETQGSRHGVVLLCQSAKVIFACRFSDEKWLPPLTEHVHYVIGCNPDIVPLYLIDSAQVKRLNERTLEPVLPLLPTRS